MVRKSCIYCCENTENGKVYIGRTNNLTRRINEHKNHAKKDGGLFHQDILKYGIEKFKYTVLEECEEELLDEKEIFYIQKAKSEKGDGYVYNVTSGGRGGQTHDIRGKNNPMYGKHKTAEEKRHLSDLLKGRPKSQETKDKISKSLKGKRKSLEAVAKKSRPVTVLDTNTNTILKFPSKSAMLRYTHADMRTLKAGKTSKNGYKLI